MAELAQSPRWWFYYDVWRQGPENTYGLATDPQWPWVRLSADGPVLDSAVSAQARAGGGTARLTFGRGVSRAFVWNGYRWDLFDAQWRGYD